MIPPHRLVNGGRVAVLEPGPLAFDDLHDLRAHLRAVHRMVPDIVVVTTAQGHGLLEAAADPAQRFFDVTRALDREPGQIGVFEGMRIFYEGAALPTPNPYAQVTTGAFPVPNIWPPVTEGVWKTTSQWKVQFGTRIFFPGRDVEEPEPVSPQTSHEVW